MIYPAVNGLLKQIGRNGKSGTRYSLVVVASKRARQLGDQDGPFMGKYDEAIVAAIDEINEGKIKVVPTLDSLAEDEAE